MLQNFTSFSWSVLRFTIILQHYHLFCYMTLTSPAVKPVFLCSYAVTCILFLQFAILQLVITHLFSECTSLMIIHFYFDKKKISCLLGFCGETEEEHAETLTLVRAVGYDMAYMFAYSMREKTHAHRNYVDDVPDDVKQRRLAELISTFRETTAKIYDSQVGTVQLVLVEGPNKRAPETEMIGKTDRGHRVSFASVPVPHTFEGDELRKPVVGDFIEVKITKSSTASLSGDVIARTSLSKFYKNHSSEAHAVAA